MRGVYCRAYVIKSHRPGIQCHGHVETLWVREIDGIPVRVQVGIDRSLRVFADEALETGVVVSRPVVVEAGAVIFPSSVLEDVRARDARADGRAEGLVRVLSLKRTGRVCERECRAESIRQEGPQAAVVGPREVLVDARTAQEVDRHAAGLLDHRETVVEIA